jgi:shikimate kinase
MGTGKSSIGRLLAEQLEYKFIDTDSIIEKQESVTISEIFRSKGEISFREMEKRVLQEITYKYNRNGFVMSTGGGMPCNPENLNYMKQNGKLIYIKSNIDDIIERINKSNTRPIIHRFEKTGDVKGCMEALLNKREYYYMQADITVINTKSDDTVEIVKTIQQKLNE